MYLSLVDIRLHYGNPCGESTVAGAGPNELGTAVEDAQQFTKRVKFADIAVQVFINKPNP